MTKINVTQDPENEVPIDIIAQAILDMSKAMKVLTSSRLNRSAVVALIKDKSQLNKNVIELVLNNLDRLEENWLKPKSRRIRK